MKCRLPPLVIVSVFITLMFPGCNQQRTIGEVIQTGEASWYGPRFHGRLTSSRERYDQSKLTAAHRTLPFETIVSVINTKNKKSVDVRINDRGPYEQNRVIDLSRAAAEELDMLEGGVAMVEIVLKESAGPIPEDLNRPTFTIQLGEYDLPSYADQFADEVGSGVRIEQRFPRGNRNPVFMIYYGSYTTFSNANADLNKLRERGLEGFVMQND